jgi:high-affinity iron transporter
MVKSLIILFREGFEAFLILFIVLGTLKQLNTKQYIKTVYWGAASALLASLFLAWVFRLVQLEFEGITEYIFEGITMIATSILLAFMILWLIRFKTNTSVIKNEVKGYVSQQRSLGIFALIFFSIFREGVETVLFFASQDFNLIGGLAGLLMAFVLCYLIFTGTFTLNFKLFFNVTTIILLLIAAGLMAHGIHELHEAKIIPEVIEHVWDINPPVLEEGVYPLFHEKGLVGEFLKGIFGYNGNPSLVEVVAYFLYLLIFSGLWYSFEKQAKTSK